MLRRYSDWVIGHHKTVVVAAMAICMLLAYGARNLGITNDFRVYFSADNPQLAAFEDLEDRFGRTDVIYFYIEPVAGDVFTVPVLRLIHELTEVAWDLPYVRRVDSLSNYQHTEARADVLHTESLVTDVEQLTTARVAEIRALALAEPLLAGRLVPSSGRATGVVVQLDLPAAQVHAPDEAVAAARVLQSRIAQQNPEVHILLGGGATAGVTLGEAVGQDLRTLVALSYLIIAGGLLLLLRSVRGMLAIILVISVATIATMGFFGWWGLVLTPVAGWVPSIVMTIAVADCVHILISYFHGLRLGQERRDAVRESLRINANPVFITSLTTIIGVLCLNFSDSPPYRMLGNMVAVGVFIAYCLSLTLLPAMLAWFNIGSSHAGKGASSTMDRLANWIIQHNRKLLLIMGVVVIALASGIPRNVLSERWHDYFDGSFEVRRATDAVEHNIGGVQTMRYVFDSGAADGIYDPEFLRALDDFSRWLRQQPDVAHVGSIVDLLKRLNQTLHNDSLEWYRVPDNRALAFQLYFLYELGLPPELSLENMVDSGHGATQLSASIKITDSERLLELDALAHDWLRAHAPTIKVGEGTGMDMVFAHINHRNIHSLVQGSLLALLLISLVLMVALRSVRLGLVSLIPNLAPAALTYGTWGYVNGRVDLSASVVLCMSLGIVVDDTVHFLSKYIRARRERGLDLVDGMRYAFQTVGTALTITTVVLVAGFLVLAASHFGPTWVTGLLLSVTLAYAWIADFFFLPPLLFVLDRKIYKKS